MFRAQVASLEQCRCSAASTRLSCARFRGIAIARTERATEENQSRGAEAAYAWIWAKPEAGRNLLPLVVRASKGVAVHIHAERRRTAEIYRALKAVFPCGIASDG